MKSLSPLSFTKGHTKITIPFRTIKSGLRSEKVACIHLIIAFLFTSQFVLAQCNNGAAFGTATAPTNNTPVTITTCAFAGEYSTINSAVAGSTYLFNATGGSGNFITIRQGTPGGTVLGFGFAPISVVCTVSGSLYLHYNTNASCGTDGSCHTGTIQCTSCAGAPNPCTNIVNLSCGTNTTATPSGSGIWNVTSCGFSTPGAERVYSFTPTSTGLHTLTTTAVSGGYIDYFYKTASGGCNATGWTCIDDINFLTTVNIGTLTAGVQYYILLDPEGTGVYSHTFRINCPTVDPCVSISTLVCATPVTAAPSGSGAWNVTSCGFTTSGLETIYSFTPSTSGAHSLQVNSVAGGYIDYFIKAASGGCNASGWTCIDDINFTGTFPMGSLTSGTAYYILLDPESTGAYSHNFQINCPAPALLTLTCPANITVSCANLVPAATGASATTNCPPAVVTHQGDVTSNQTCPNRYTITRTYMAVDACGSSTTCTQTITVNDITPPSITCPAAVTVQCALSVPAANTASVISSDACGGATTVTHVSDVTVNQTCANRYTINRTYRATDVCGNSGTCIQVITVNDITPPTLTCPAAVTVQCASLVPAPNTNLVTADNCSGGAPVVTLFSSITTNQTCINRYTLTRTYRSTDVCGNFTTCTQNIVVFDNISPTITFNDPMLNGVPNGGTIAVQCLGQDPDWDPPSFGSGSVNVSDNCTGAVNVSFSETTLGGGNCPSTGYINRYMMQWTATDACGNSSTAHVFLELVDDIPPVLLGVPDDITVSCDDLPPVPDNIMATDECLCACVIEYNQSNPSPGCQDGQVIVRSWTARDDCGNETIGIQNILLRDDKGPDIQLIHPQLTGLTDGAILDYTCNEGGIPEFYENLGALSAVVMNTCGVSPPVSYHTSVHKPNNCQPYGYIEQRTSQWHAIDQCGNESTLTLRIRLIDDEIPVIHDVPEMTCMDDPALELVEASDNCEKVWLRSWDVNIPNPCGNGNAVRRTFEAYDACGNMIRDTAILIPDNNNGPALEFTHADLAGLGQGETLIVECNSHTGSYTVFGQDDVSASADCDNGTSITFEEILLSTGDCAGEGLLAEVLLKWTASDMCGNSSQLTAIVHVVDNTPPVLHNFSSNQSIGCHDPLPEVTASDNCGEAQLTITEIITPGDCENEYIVHRTFVAADPCGNAIEQSQTIHVGNHDGPVISGAEDGIICNEQSLPDVTAIDPCSGDQVEVTMTESIVDIACRDGIVTERIWTATDACGNVSEVRQMLIAQDNTPPAIMIPSHSVANMFTDNEENLVLLSQTNIMERLDALDVFSFFIADECEQAIDPTFSLDVTYADDCIIDAYFERRTYTWEARDICGNASTVTFTVDILDDISPVISELPANTTIICTDLPPVDEIEVDDYAENVTVAYSQTIVPGENAGEFNVIRTWTATDPCGNQSQSSQSILWIPDTFLDCDILPPGAVDCNTHNLEIGSLTSGGIEPLTYEWTVEGEKCFIQGGQGTPDVQIYVGFSEVMVTLTMTDAFGCTSSCQTFIDCIDPLDDSFSSNQDAPQNFDLNGVSQELGEIVFDDSSLIRYLHVFPNPASATINITFESMMEYDVAYRLTNFLGQIMIADNMPAQKGFNSRKLDIGKLHAGSYLLQVKTDEEKHEKIIVIMR